MVNAGNDIAYARQGRIESLVATDQFGDVETDDLTNPIADLVSDYTDWTLVYNQRNQRIYCIPASQSECWVYFKPIAGSNLSPWVLWETAHSSSFSPTCIMNGLDPVTGLEYVFFGDSSGRLYRMEGTGSGDAGDTDIAMEFKSGLIKAPLDADIYEIEGYLKYRGGDAFTVTLNFIYQGRAVFNKPISFSVGSDSSRAYYGGSYYYGGAAYYGSDFGKFYRRKFATSGRSTEFQVEVSVEGTASISINEIGLQFRAAT